MKRIAICGGSGEKFYPQAIAQRADVYITGDIYYHTAHDMQSAGLIAIDPGHYIESLCKQRFIEKFESWKQEENWDINFSFLKQIQTHFNLIKRREYYVRKSFATFLRYVKTETRSDATSKTTPSTQTQVAFAQELKKLEELGLADVFYNEDNGFVMGTLPSNVDHEVRSIGFISHMDTADFNAVGVNPQIIENYDGESTIVLDAEERYTLNTKDFPNLKNYEGHTLITTDGSTLLGADDKSGIAEIMTAMEILINNPSIPHGTIKVAFGPDEEIGVGADKFDVEQFDVDFAYTVDGGPLGELQYETFSAAQANITIQGKNVHPGTAKDTMINALQLAIDFHNQLPADEVPEKRKDTKVSSI